MQKLSDLLYVVDVGHHATFDLQTLLMIQPYNPLLNAAEEQPWWGVLHCSGILCPQSELKTQLFQAQTRDKSSWQWQEKAPQLPPLIKPQRTPCKSKCPNSAILFTLEKQKLEAELFWFLDVNVQSFKWNPVPDHFISELNNSYFGDETWALTEFSKSCH